MLNKLDGYDVTEAELQEYLAALTVPAFDVEVKEQKNLFEVYCNGTLLYYSEIVIEADEERERLKDCWLLEQAQKHFEDKKIVPATEPEPLPELTDRELLERLHELLLESAINSEYLACLAELNLL